MSTTGTKVIAQRDHSTIRHTECSMLIPQSATSDRCGTCIAYRKTLNRSVGRKLKATETTTPHSHTNLRYLSSSDMVARINELQHKQRLLTRKVSYLSKKLTEITAEYGVCLDNETNRDLETVMRQQDEHVTDRYPKDSFLYLFWQQQKEALKTNAKGRRWHPMMVRWCLYLRHQSSKAYELLRETGIALPSQRTLRDYTHCFKAGTGFSNNVDGQLVLASKVLTCEEWEKYVVVLIDEMYIRYANNDMYIHVVNLVE